MHHSIAPPKMAERSVLVSLHVDVFHFRLVCKRDILLAWTENVVVCLFIQSADALKQFAAKITSPSTKERIEVIDAVTGHCKDGGTVLAKVESGFEYFTYCATRKIMCYSAV